MDPRSTSLSSSDCQLGAVQWSSTFRVGSSSTTDSCRSGVVAEPRNPLPVSTNTWPAPSTAGASPPPQMAPPCSPAAALTSKVVGTPLPSSAADTSQPW
jgi:hypothetical protein